MAFLDGLFNKKRNDAQQTPSKPNTQETAQNMQQPTEVLLAVAEKLLNPGFIICQRPFVRHRKVQVGFDGLRNIRNGFFHFADTAFDAIDNPVDDIRSPAESGGGKSRDEAHCIIESVLYRVVNSGQGCLDAAPDSCKYLGHS